MNDIRRTILWVVFGFSLVLLWDRWQIHNGHKGMFSPSVTNPVIQTRSDAPTDVPNPSQAQSSVNTGVAGLVGGVDSSETMKKKQLVEFKTDVYKLTFDLSGGASLVRAELLKHAGIENAKENLVLLDDSRERNYWAQSGLIGQVGWPNHKTPMRLVSAQRELENDQDTLNIVFESDVMGGVKLVKTWSFRRGAYDAKVKHEVMNLSTATIAPQLYVQIVRDGNKPPGESSFYSTFTGPAVYTDAQKFQKVEFSEIAEGKADFEKKSDNGFVAMVQHYFASAWIFPPGLSHENFFRKIDANLYAVGMIAPMGEVAPGGKATSEEIFFAGPQIEKELEALAPGLELVKDYGWVTILSKPLYWLLDKLNEVLGNWGWAIVALVVLLKAAFFWLNAKAYASMAKMKAINPRIMQMRERLKDNPQQMQQEMMKIYREEKVNPLGGCLPILIQIPVFIALYWVLLSSVEMRNAPWIGWVTDLAKPDPWFILPVLMTASSLLQTWLNPTPPDPMQAKLMWIMPLAFGVMFFFFPAGLVLYWLTNNVLSIAQQWLINKRLGVN